MALEPNPITGRVSMADIAATMGVDPEPATAGDEDTAVSAQAEDTVTTDEDTLDAASTDDTLGTGTGEDEDDGILDEDDESLEASDDATDEEEDAKDDEDPEIIELTDDYTLEVTVDGETRQVTLGDLKQNFSGEGAIDKRLQEATEARKAATAERAAVQQELDTGRQNLVRAFQMFDEMMFQPSVSAPDERLRQTNPQEYLLQETAYRNDQASLGQRRAEVKKALDAYNAREAQNLQQKRAENSQKLLEKMPELRDPEKAKVVEELILEGVRHYGFSEQEISEAYDERMFRMAHDAAQFRRMKAGQQVQPAPQTQKTKKVLKPSPSGAVKQATAKARKAKAALEQARKSGKAEDIANTL